MSNQIKIFNAHQNNLKHLDVSFNTAEITVITGVSGSGKSSLAFDTLYAEGQRKYVETFSPYARQFLDRMDKPQVDKIEGVLPAIAIDQTNPVRTSRSTVGTMTELNDHIKLLFAHSARLFCQECAQEVKEDSVSSIQQALVTIDQQHPDSRLVLTFPISVPGNFSEEEILSFLQQQGYTRIQDKELITVRKATSKKTTTERRQRIYVIQDRFRYASAESSRVSEAIEACLKHGQGHCRVYVLDKEKQVVANYKFSQHLHCATCDIDYQLPIANLFSYNSPVGACEECRGFGRSMGIDYGLVVPNEALDLEEGAIKPFQTPTYMECQEELLKYAKKHKVRVDTPWRDLTEAEKHWVIHGDPDFGSQAKPWKQQWYGVARFFEFLERKSYKMHVRIMLSKYRSYSICPVCHGSRLKPQGNLWRLGQGQLHDYAEGRYPRFMPVHAKWSRQTLNQLPGLSMFDLMTLPISHVREFFASPALDRSTDKANELVLTEIRHRLKFLCDVGLGYLNLDRQSRTLSGGEVQRINLTTALGTSLVNTLFVLDEPSIGLHPHDMESIITVMQRLRNAGNTLVVVEHDPQVMVAADRILEIGPGPGEKGGDIVFDGSAAQLRQANTLTGQYLSAQKQVQAPMPTAVSAKTPRLLLEGVQAHNLKNCDVAFPLNRLVCVTGVSGSGKSTLIQDVLYPALLKHFGKPTEAPGPYQHLLGAEQFADVVFVDQSPIGKTARSNPASYVGAFNPIRKLFANAPLSVERGYKPGTFSFNSGNGRCPVCAGTGFEHVEMQFLSDVYLRCPECQGTRFRQEIREVRLEHLGRSASIDEVLAMTVSEALDFFKGLRDVQTALQPLLDVGLEYVTLGQAVPTLSGGEAQRLKLAGHLAESARSRGKRQAMLTKGTLFLFDEPTTGLHFDDIARLMQAFRKLLAAGHSLIIIEHNLDLIKAADWVIDLGPHGGEQGGQVIAQCSPEQLKTVADSLTGQALLQYDQDIVTASGGALQDQTQESTAYLATTLRKPSIEILNAAENNLKNIQVEIPRDTFTVITGVSGSGKSTLAFDILFNEGQRRYLESLNAYARSIVQPAGKPDVDAIYGIPPTVAIEQRTSRGGHKSTVGTMTEIHHFLRLLYVKLGTQFCPDCHVPVEPQSPEQIMAYILHHYKGQEVQILAPLITARKGYYTDLASWAKNKGYDYLRVDGEMIAVDPWPRLDRYQEHNIQLPVAQLQIDAKHEHDLFKAITAAVHYGQGLLMVLNPAAQIQHFSTKRACPSCARSFPEPDPRLFSYNSKHGWCPSCFGTGLNIKGFDEEQSGEEKQWQQEDEDTPLETCSRCHGSRLNEVARAVYWHEKPITEISAMTIAEVASFFRKIKLSPREREIARDILQEINSRTAFMQEVGLDYLNLDRSAPTLSGGEAQRIRLAAQLGSNLQGVCYVLDEPTIGLHPRDNRILLNALSRLEHNGNTLVVVEHDEDTIRKAQHIIDIGPGAGSRGGTVVAQGTYEDIVNNPDSVTGRYLAQGNMHPLQVPRKTPKNHPMLQIKGAQLHNLQNVDVAIPLQRLSVVTGVSGSGKSTLARDVLLKNLKHALSQNAEPAAIQWQGCQSIQHWQSLDRVLEVDQTPIGKTPRSCPATYIGFWDDVRKQFAQTRDAKLQGWSASRFSFNTGDGRCPICDGQGVKTIEMSFLPDVKIPCEACHGARFNPDTLMVELRGKNVTQVLQMEVDEALSYFQAHPKVHRALKLLQDVGLGYLTLGQPSPTLSGGEAQRIKLVTELVKARLDEGVMSTGRASRRPHTLYVLDEPTVGLSMADVEKLIKVLHRLVDAGNTVVVIEHNLDIMAEADWLVDMGPEGGDGGGRLVAAGDPATVMKARAHSHTGQVLYEFMQADSVTH
ncbi:excinuclease ABC subunit UvrA [Brackiella oedipodis]|uniref:excinuclease ABC subunit UvrA n=1 Tax=Brackiella oedipodis TaxID=124225 RepID=UPI000490C503|nr:excinuclease ABC subunit UvrA [Brackiella oedipodis]